jgi:flavorubredoxin
MDHSGCLTEVIDLVKPEKVFASAMGVKALHDHFHDIGEIIEVKDGGQIDIGGMAVTFYETRLLHWPDSMFSYLADEGILFSQDAFGMHLASSERFDDEINGSILRQEAAKYYANILMPFSPIVLRLFEKVESSGLEPKLIAPDHGPIWRKDTGLILGLYQEWAKREPRRKAVVAYDTMWGSTDKMAKAISDGLIGGGASVKVMRLRSAHRSDIATELLDAGALIVGSPTINGTIFPTVADVLTYVRGLKPTGLVGAAFASYGWSGESLKQLVEYLSGMNVELVSEGIRAKYVPDGEALAQCRDLGTTVAKRLEKLPPPG